jgi:hypothetical protein
MPPGGFGSKIMIKTDNAMDVRTGQIQFDGDDRYRFRWHIPEMVLNTVKNGQKGARFALQRINNGSNLFVPDRFF